MLGAVSREVAAHEVVGRQRAGGERASDSFARERLEHPRRIACQEQSGIRWIHCAARERSHGVPFRFSGEAEPLRSPALERVEMRPARDETKIQLIAADIRQAAVTVGMDLHHDAFAEIRRSAQMRLHRHAIAHRSRQQLEQTRDG